MTVRIRVDEPTALSDAQAFLLRAGFIAVQVGSDSLEVYAPGAAGRAPRFRLQRTLERWVQDHPGVAVELVD
jgi:hypothetical protein